MSCLQVDPSRLESCVAESAEVKPSGTPDPEAVEWLRGAMSGTSLPQGNDAAVDPSGNSLQAVDGTAGSSRTLADRILKSLRGAGSDVSTRWHQANVSATDLQRSIDNVGNIATLIDLQKKNATAFVYLDMLSKMVGKAVYTIDSLGRN